MGGSAAPGALSHGWGLWALPRRASTTQPVYSIGNSSNTHWAMNSGSPWLVRAPCVPGLGHGALGFFPVHLPTVGRVVIIVPGVRTKEAEAERLGNFSKVSGSRIYPQVWLHTELWNLPSQMGVCLRVHVHRRVYSLGGAAFSGRRRHFP